MIRMDWYMQTEYIICIFNTIHFQNQWGNLCWGHAVSEDLLHWKQLDTVMFPEKDGSIFSGCGIVNERGLLKLPDSALLFFTRWQEARRNGVREKNSHSDWHIVWMEEKPCRRQQSRSSIILQMRTGIQRFTGMKIVRHIIWYCFGGTSVWYFFVLKIFRTGSVRRPWNWMKHGSVRI